MTADSRQPATVAVRETAEVITSCRFRWHDEDRLQAAIAAAFQAHGWHVEREVRLDRRQRGRVPSELRGSRIDLLVGRVGIEVKVAGAPAAVLAQIYRYLTSDLLVGLVLVTSRANHLALPRLVYGKPVQIVSLLGAAL